MVNITFEIDGRRAAPEDLPGAERRTLERIAKAMEDKFRSLFTPAELAQLSVRMTGGSVDDLEMNVNGPDYLVDRLRE
jgi:hypothetical protein